MASWWKYSGVGLQTSAEILGTISSDARARNQAQLDSYISSNNAISADYEAYQAIDRGKLNLNQFKRDFEQVQGSARVRSGGSGIVVGEGSSLDVLMSNAGEAARQEQMIRYNANLEAYQKNQEAYNYRYRAYAAAASAPSGLDTAIGVAGSLGGAAIGLAG